MSVICEGIEEYAVDHDGESYAFLGRVTGLAGLAHGRTDLYGISH